MDIQGRATTRLRYRFSNLAQARAHLRDSEGRALFFYRDEKLRLLPYAPVCLEFKFDDGAEPRVLHGEVLDSLEGSGTWMEILDPRPVTSVAEYTRSARRMGCDFTVELRLGGRITNGRLLDLGTGGVRVGGVALATPGEQVEIRLLSSDRLTFRDLAFGHVAWAQGSELGVRFDPTDLVGRSAVTRLARDIESEWQRAWESVHPHFCCRDQGVIEPEPPRLPHADDITGKIAL